MTSASEPSVDDGRRLIELFVQIGDRRVRAAVLLLLESLVASTPVQPN
jgi:hypothetical protein